MECDPDYSEEIHFKGVLMLQDDYLIPPILNEDQSNQKETPKEPEKEITINQMIDNESFEKAFNQIFLKKSYELEPEEEPEQPLIKNSPVEIINFIPYKDKNIVIKVEDKNDKISPFPFTKGQGIEKTLDIIGFTANYSNSKIKLLNKNTTFNSKFKITSYYTDENGKKKKQKKKRKYKPDDIRKKIKARFHKIIKNIINSKLKRAGSAKLFDFLPQNFITNITINLNSKIMNLTYENLIEQEYNSKINLKNGKSDLNKYNNNMEVLNYLKKNPEICKKSEFEKIKNMKYIDILKAYFSSFEFEQSIIELNDKNETIEYMEEYINKSLNYVNFFNFNKKIYNDNTIANNNEKNCNKFKISYNSDDEEELEE